MTALLPISDDMDRALLEFKKSNNNDLIQGFELIYTKFNEILTSKGLNELKVKKGDKFNNFFEIFSIKINFSDYSGEFITILVN